MKIEPQKEHEWLQQLVGEWAYEGWGDPGPGQPALEFSGKEIVRPIGGLWILAEANGEMPGGGGPMTMLITLGYDPAGQRYTGTFVGSMMTHIWIYEGELDDTGRVLTLSTEGPSMKGDGSIAKFQDIIEIVSPERRVLRARVQGADGTWTQLMESQYRRIG